VKKNNKQQRILRWGFAALVFLILCSAIAYIFNYNRQQLEKEEAAIFSEVQGTGKVIPLLN